ncbi:MAG: DNA translocase FtsK 4TM domain-containing protein [Chitinophagaceae bacterium]
MSNKAKSKKGQATETGKLKTEKDQPLPIKNLVKDERTHKITGAVLILLAFFLFVAFASYLFTWKADMKIVFNQGLSPLFSSVKTTNLLGNLGAVVAHFFFYYGFGIASFLLCTFFFVSGVNLLFGKKLFSVWRNTKYVITGLVFFSVALAFIMSGSGFPWGGGFGENISKFLVQAIGTLGTAAVLSIVGLAYIIWRFNPVFKVPQLPERKKVIPADADEQSDEDQEATLFIETPAGNGKGNSLKKGSALVIPPREAFEAPPFELKLTENDEQDDFDGPPAVEVPPIVAAPPVKPEKRGKQLPEVSFEINEVAQVTEGPNDTTLEIESERKAVLETDLYEPTLDLRDYKYPSLDLLETHGSEKIIQDPGELETNKNRIIETLKNYDIAIQKISATVGPTVTLYEIVPAAGVRISRIKNLEDDIALSLAALGIRIIAPIPGKGTIGIEVPNVKKTVVSMKTLLNSEKFQNSAYSLPIAIGKKIDNENFIVDLTTMPHLLMAGATGQGKSVGLNAILVSLLYKKHPSHLKLVLIDPKKVELSIYRTIEKHFLAKLPGEEDAIITDTKKVIHTLNALCIEMDNRYDLLKEAGARNIKEYNDKFVRRRLNPEKGHQYLPFIVLVIDEFADLIMTAGKEVEMPIARLAQLARAIGIHLIIATQRPSVNIITGTIKANFPARIAFKVSSKIDSRTILDTGGAEQLIGKGDMLISYNGELTRLQCAFVDTPEVEEITNFIGDQRGYTQAFLLPEYVDEKEMEGKDFDLSDRDSLFDDAARLIVQSQSGSTSLLQRRMKLGYNRAGRLMDQLEAAGIVGPNQGSKVRDVLIKTEADLQQQLGLLG